MTEKQSNSGSNPTVNKCEQASKRNVIVATCDHLKKELSPRTDSVMPKMKTKSSAKKRFRVRPGGTVKRGQAFKRHILTKKTTKTKRQLRGSTAVHASNMVSVKSMMPNA